MELSPIQPIRPVTFRAALPAVVGLQAVFDLEGLTSVSAQGSSGEGENAAMDDDMAEYDAEEEEFGPTIFSPLLSPKPRVSFFA